MYNLIVGLNIFVVVGLFLITCPNEGNGHPMLDYDWALGFKPRLQSPWKRDGIWTGMETGEEFGAKVETTTNPYSNDEFENNQKEPVSEPPEGAEVPSIGLRNYLENKRNGKGSHNKNSVAHFNGGQKNYVSEMLFGRKPTAMVFWLPKT